MLGQIDLASESLFAGRYRVVRRIAAGGMGAVFEVIHVETQRRRALKVMLPELLANQQLRERFQMEARITANVDTEYIVDVFDAGIDEATGMPFLVMELLNGEDLAKAQEKTGPLAPLQVVTYLRQVASALDKTHAAGIIHRDLKPENLFLTHREDGTPRVKILDFGISKVVTEAKTGANTTRGLGTPLYMAPEQVLAQTMSPATDLYALGLIAYTLLVGVPYWQFEADTFDSAIAFVVHTSKGTTDSAVNRAAQAGQFFPAAFEAWFRRATHLDPTKRFRSASEQVSELAAVLGVNVPFAGGLGPDSTGAVRSSAVSSAATMVARTAPGTGFDRQGTLSGESSRGRTALWLGLGAAALAGIGLVSAFALHSGPFAGSVAGEVKSGTALPVASSATPVATAPVVSVSPTLDSAVPATSGSAAAVASGEHFKPTAVASAPAKPVSIGKGAAPTHKVAPIAKPAPAPAQPRKYTRD